ncbi:hypothetical protein, partial [Vibrio anguillarum]
ELVITPGCDRIKTFRSCEYEFELSHQGHHFSLLKLNVGDALTICGFVHLPSRRYHSEEQIMAVFRTLYHELSQEEENSRTTRTILVGDFNNNPFDKPMVSFYGMACTNGIDCSKRTHVTSVGESKSLFYNPMWSLYSTMKDKPGGHKYSRLEDDVVSWHMLDQVIMRPSMVEYFDFDELKIVDSTLLGTLVNRNGKPSLSDHLPLVCKFNL